MPVSFFRPPLPPTFPTRADNQDEQARRSYQTGEPYNNDLDEHFYPEEGARIQMQMIDVTPYNIGSPAERDYQRSVKGAMRKRMPSGQCVVLHGVTADRQQVIVEWELIKPFFYVRLPKHYANGGAEIEWTPSAAERLLALWKTNDVEPTSYKLSYDQPIIGFCGEERFPFLRLEFNTTYDMLVWSKRLDGAVPCPPFTGPVNQRSKFVKLEKFEDDYDILMKPFLEKDLTHASWIEFYPDPRKQVTIEDGRSPYVHHHYRLTGDLIHRSTRKDIANNVMLSFDIETISHTFNFPDANNALDRITSISNRVQVLTGNDKIDRAVCDDDLKMVVFMLRSDPRERSEQFDFYRTVYNDVEDMCDMAPLTPETRVTYIKHEPPADPKNPEYKPKSLGMIEVRWFDDEALMLKAWAVFVREEANPDIVTGYNIFRFDIPYICTRAKLLGIEDAVFRMGCCGFRQEQKITEVSSKGFGTIQLFLLPMEGRILWDMYTYIKKAKALDEYTLDFVSKKYIKKGKIETEFDCMWVEWLMWNFKEQAKYVMEDANCVGELIPTLFVQADMIQTSRVCRIPIIYQITRLEGICSYSQVQRAAMVTGRRVRKVDLSRFRGLPSVIARLAPKPEEPRADANDTSTRDVEMAAGTDELANVSEEEWQLYHAWKIEQMRIRESGTNREKRDNELLLSHGLHFIGSRRLRRDEWAAIAKINKTLASAAEGRAAVAMDVDNDDDEANGDGDIVNDKVMDADDVIDAFARSGGDAATAEVFGVDDYKLLDDVQGGGGASSVHWSTNDNDPYSFEDKKFYQKLYTQTDDDADMEAEKNKFEGGCVLTPHIGLHTDPIATLDFASLYPSLIMQRQLCYSSLVIDERYLDLPGYIYKHYVIRPGLVYTFAREDPAGYVETLADGTQVTRMRPPVRPVLPLIEEELVAERRAVRAEGEDADVRVKDLTSDINTVHQSRRVAVLEVAKQTFSDPVLREHMVEAAVKIREEAKLVDLSPAEVKERIKDMVLFDYDAFAERLPASMRDTVERLAKTQFIMMQRKLFVETHEKAVQDAAESAAAQAKVAQVGATTEEGKKAAGKAKALAASAVMKFARAEDLEKNVKMMETHTFDSFIAIKTDESNTQEAFSKAQDARQLKIKRSCNALYGFTGALVGKLPCQAVAFTITFCGRQGLMSVMEYMRSKPRVGETDWDSKMHFDVDNDIVYGDTDSVFVKFKIPDEYKITVKLVRYTKEELDAMSADERERVLKKQQENKQEYDRQLLRLLRDFIFPTAKRACAEITSKLFTAPMKLEFEKVYMPFCIFNKKRYFGGKWIDDPKEAGNPIHNDPFIEYKGVQVKRRDTCRFTRDVLIEAVETLVATIDIQEMCKVVESQIELLSSGKVNTEALVFSQGLNKHLPEHVRHRDDYDVLVRDKCVFTGPTLPAHAIVARKNFERSPLEAERINERVKMLCVVFPNRAVLKTSKSKKPKEFKLSENVEGAKYAIKHKLKVNYAYYVEKQLGSLLKNILEVTRGPAFANMFIGRLVGLAAAATNGSVRLDTLLKTSTPPSTAGSTSGTPAAAAVAMDAEDCTNASCVPVAAPPPPKKQEMMEILPPTAPKKARKPVDIRSLFAAKRPSDTDEHLHPLKRPCR